MRFLGCPSLEMIRRAFYFLHFIINFDSNENAGNIIWLRRFSIRPQGEIFLLILNRQLARISDNVNPEYRSGKVELDIMNDGVLSSGMYADVTINTTPQKICFMYCLLQSHPI